MRGPTASGLDPVPYLRAAGLDPDDPGVVVDERGNRSLVLVAADRGRVWRFPRWPEDLALLPTATRRLSAAGALGLPAPRLLDVVLDAPLGSAHLVTSYVPGLAMDDLAVAALPSDRLRRLGADLADLLMRLAAVPWDRWPATEPPWPRLWADSVARMRRLVLPRLDPEDAADAAATLAAAEATAAATTCGVIHGDLGGVNVRVDPASGAITGVLDWDGAIAGDGAVDVAAVAAGAPVAVVAAVLQHRPALAADLARHDRYLATWPLQEVLYGIERGDDDLVRDGLARWRQRAQPG